MKNSFLKGILSKGLLVALLAMTGKGCNPLQTPPPTAAATSEQVHAFCGACHTYPPPDTIPRALWRKEVKQGYDFAYKDATLRIPFPPLESVVRYYEERAPLTFPLAVPEKSAGPPPIPFERQGHVWPGQADMPGVTHVRLVRLLKTSLPQVLVCDANRNQVLLFRPDTQPPSWQVLARGYCCASAQVVDLDGDGLQDVVLACLGSFYATDDRVGSLIWLRGSATGAFTAIPILAGVGRVADAGVADFDQDGKLDLVVAVFGWRQTGGIYLLQNRTTDWSRPVFVSELVDSRHGASHVRVTDLNGDGRSDFVALFSQAHETVVAFLNEGLMTSQMRFRLQSLFTAPHPAFGCNGLELADLDGDGDLDVLLTNGDALDAPYFLRPYHGVHWLENRGTYPFTAHRLTALFGAGSPVAVDVDGDRDLDVIASSYLPAAFYPERAQQNLDSVILLEQTSRGKFVRHSLETVRCDHLACCAGDVDGDSRPDLVLGNHVVGKHRAEDVVIWKNRPVK